jgi:hypothetical protein
VRTRGRPVRTVSPPGSRSRAPAPTETQCERPLIFRGQGPFTCPCVHTSGGM